MGKEWYGSVTNRIEEGKNYTGREIKSGDDLTMYHWSDRTCYYVTAVENQKRIKVKRYYVCADKSKPGGIWHQDWMYFKTMQEMDAYLGYDPRTEQEYAQFDREETWVFRYNKWMSEHILTEMRHPDAYNKRERDAFAKNGFFKVYSDLSGSVSFGVRNYYYDWEF